MHFVDSGIAVIVGLITHSTGCKSADIHNMQLMLTAIELCVVFHYSTDINTYHFFPLEMVVVSLRTHSMHEI